MEPSKDAISVRVSRLNSQVLNKLNDKTVDKTGFYLNREGLFDTLQTLYDECNSECLKSNDKNIAHFVDKYRKYILELKKLRVNITDFEIKNVIGRGHFGDVHVVKERQTGDVYALKTVRKYESSKEKSASFEEERNIMAEATSPWITKLRYAFQDTCTLYYIMEYQPGGDLLGLLYRQGGSIPESAATFYLAELITAINDLHMMGYVHRDIKPDNILLDRCGHLKLADFGSAAKINAQGFVSSGSMPVGTPDYIAPETLQSLDAKTAKQSGKYGKSCDYWSMGILAYELTIGHTPFSGQNTTATYSKIINFSKSLKFPSDILLTQAYLNLIKSLLVDQATRLDYNQIVKHPLFKNVDFNGLRDQVPPFVPKISSEDDTSNFSDVQIKKRPPNMENFKGKVQFSGKNLPFIGFTFTTDPGEYKEAYKSSILAKDERVEQLKLEIEGLQRELIKNSSKTQDKDNLVKKLEEKARKLESVESVRDNLERDLANNIAECQALKRTLEIERKDRSDLERKALELIKSAKLKWESAEKIKLENLNQQIDDYKGKIENSNKEIAKLTEQLQKAEHLSNTHKSSIENVEKLRRSSVIGLESRLEKVTLDTQNKVARLQHQLSEAKEEKRSLETRLSQLENTEIELRNQLALSEKNCNELKNKCKESDAIIETLKKNIARLETKSEDLDLHKELIRSLEQQIGDIQNNKSGELEMKKLSDSNAVLNKQVKDLKGELNSFRASKMSSIEDLKGKYEDQLKTLDLQVKQLNDDKVECEIKLQEANLKLQSGDEKTTVLEGLLQQLQGDLAKLESGSEREGVLKEQIERLEQQLVEVSSSAAIDKQELMQLKSKCWRLEKDLGNAELDRKIVERDLKEEKTLNKKLTKDIRDMEIKIEEINRANKSVLIEMGSLNEGLSEKLEETKKEMKAFEVNFENIKVREKKLLENIEELKVEVKDKELKICAVLDTLDNVKKDNIILNCKLSESKESLQSVKSEMENKEREIVNLKNDFEKCKSDLENSLLNRKALRDACTFLENQLVEFETILDCSEAKKNQLQTDLQKLQSELTKYKNDIVESRRKCNEEKSLKLLAETKVKRLLDDIENDNIEIASFKAENEDLKKLTSKLSDDLNEIERQMGDYQVTIKSYERQIDNYVSENNYLKEENSEQITFINSMKESNYKLGHRFNESQAVIKDLLEKLNELDALLNEKTQYFNERELKLSATIQQQTKLIDFLQSKVEESNKKKKTFSDKLFGIHTKKENVPPQSLALNYRDLEIQLAKEKEQNKNLNKELIKLKTETFRKGEKEIKSATLQCLENQEEILAQIVQSPSSQKSDFRRNSIQRMHHNIPHRFESKLCTKSSKCAQCGNQILLGRHMSVCRECHVATHTNCASTLPRTCGLPTEFAKHYSDKLNKMNSESSSSLQSSNSIVKNEQINIEGWVKIPHLPNGWEKHYACLTETALKIYKEPPNNDNCNNKPIQKLKLVNDNEYGKVILEPVPSEIPVPVANSDLPFVIKVETSPNSTCWPSQSILFMTLSVEDKERWFSGLQNILQSKNKGGDIILQDTEDLDINSIMDIGKNSKLLATETGLYSLQKNKLVRIEGLSVVYEIQLMRNINTVVMIAERKRCLISCDLNHLISLCECAPCSKPTLQYHQIMTSNLDGFHILKSTDSPNSNFVCTANTKNLLILKYDANKKEFALQRVLDTAQPVSCILFTDHTLLIGADKFFEVDLNTFQADEFLDISDAKLSHAVQCFRLKSFPVSILRINRDTPKEYLVCFNEFATFVDEYGRSTRKNDIYWTHVPKAFYFDGKYLYVLQYNAVEVYKIGENTCNGNEGEVLSVIKVELSHAQYLGDNEKGIYVLAEKQIRFIDARNFDDSVSISISETLSPDVDENMSGSNSDRFSFTSSMMQSLDGHLSDEEGTYMNHKKVTFTDL